MRFGKMNTTLKISSTITVHIRHLREKLNDTSDTPQYIKTDLGCRLQNLSERRTL